MQQQIEVRVDEETLKGRYTNHVNVSINNEEALLDCFLIHPPTGGQMVARIVSSPGHLKRIRETIDRVIKAHEQQHGKIEIADEPKKEVGFRVEDKK